MKELLLDILGLVKCDFCGKIFTVEKLKLLEGGEWACHECIKRMGMEGDEI